MENRGDLYFKGQPDLVTTKTVIETIKCLYEEKGTTRATRETKMTSKQLNQGTQFDQDGERRGGERLRVGERRRRLRGGDEERDEQRRLSS